MANEAANDSDGTSLTVSCVVRVPIENCFAAWTESQKLQSWWGPEGVTCIGAEIDLREHGLYRIGNKLPDGKLIWITGRFLSISPPNELVYTWQIGDDASAVQSLVRVNFQPKDAGTEVTVTHSRNVNAQMRDSHLRGWLGCLRGLETYFQKLQPS